MLLQVVQKTFTLTDQLHKAPVSREVFLVGLKMIADLADPLGEQSDLSLDGTRYSWPYRHTER